MNYPDSGCHFQAAFPHYPLHRFLHSIVVGLVVWEVMMKVPQQLLCSLPHESTTCVHPESYGVLDMENHPATGLHVPLPVLDTKSIQSPKPDCS